MRNGWRSNDPHIDSAISGQNPGAAEIIFDNNLHSHFFIYFLTNTLSRTADQLITTPNMMSLFGTPSSMEARFDDPNKDMD